MAPPILFSIVIPTRDRPLLLSRVLSALRAQTFVDFEVIVSDNSLNVSCADVVQPYLSDERFSYKQPPHPMSMPDHWHFAIEGVRGRYVTIFNEKFILCPDALEIMAAEIQENPPDVLTWQFEVFDSRQAGDALFFGKYHPKIKPGNAFAYEPDLELRRRFSFDFPVFSRYEYQKNNYGKIYTGFVRSEVLEQVREKYGSVFLPTSPDFTSMTAILNESSRCVDMNKSLMLLNNAAGMSNGEDTRASMRATRRAVENLGLDFDEYARELPIANFPIGHNNYIAADLALVKSRAPDGLIKSLDIDRESLAYWAMKDLEQITDFQSGEMENYRKVLEPFLDGMSRQRRVLLDEHAALCGKGSRSEIYHSGLTPIDEFRPGTSPEALAEIHWLDGLAPPRKSVMETPLELSDAMDYLHRYNIHARHLLGLA
ncbi:glycosyltransferase family A protein [Castellaniella sp.]|uniref:glycosyltransferase family A protein n=1 Tax=Castellaniella sp. TaxID=1955812 RepID=UPI003C707EAE